MLPDFYSNGQNEKIKFNVLGIETKIPRFKSYSDDGFQNNIVEYVKSIAKKYWNPVFDKDLKLASTLVGICLRGSPFLVLPLKVHIGYIDIGNDFVNTINRAHEETHALENLGKIKLLENIIFEKYKKKLELKKTDNETRAQIGSLYVLAQYPCFSFMSFTDFTDTEVIIYDEKS